MYANPVRRGRVTTSTSPEAIREPRTGPRGWALAAAWVLFWAAAAVPSGLYSWHYFVEAGTRLVGGGPSGGLHLFAAQREFQFGPVSVLAAWALTRVPRPLQDPLAAAAMTGLGAVTYGLIVQAASAILGRRPHKATTTTVGLAFVPIWMTLAVHFGHLDDVLALTFIAAAVAAVARGRSVLTVVSLALATGAKPWALPLGLLVLALEPRWGSPLALLGWRPPRARLAALFVALVVLPWAPFVLADAGTLAIGTFRIDVAPDSVLALFGQTGTTPPWDRPTQLLLATLVAWWCVRTGRWVAAPLAVLTVRMLLDPGTYGYYTAGLAVAAALIDLSARRRPVFTPAILVWWLTSLALNAAHLYTVAAIVRLAALISMLVLAVTTVTQDSPGVPVIRSRRRAELTRSRVIRRTSPVSTRELEGPLGWPAPILRPGPGRPQE